MLDIRVDIHVCIHLKGSLFLFDFNRNRSGYKFSWNPPSISNFDCYSLVSCVQPEWRKERFQNGPLRATNAPKNVYFDEIGLGLGVTAKCKGWWWTCRFHGNTVFPEDVNNYCHGTSCITCHNRFLVNQTETWNRRFDVSTVTSKNLKCRTLPHSFYPDFVTADPFPTGDVCISCSSPF
jgi:hypothetical protein